MSKKKAIVATAFLLFLIILAFLIPHFLVNYVEACHRHRPPRHPPLGKTIIKYFVYPDGTPIGECLEVELWNNGNEPIAYGHTDAEGKVVFVGLYDGTFTIEYDWQGIHHEEMVRIDCSKVTWEFTNKVPYWTIEKTFYYDLDPLVPISHLTVKLNGYEGITDEDGLVVFIDLKAGTYTLEWVWGSETKTEEVIIGFQTPSPVVLTNYLEPKSGGQINLHLAEEIG